MRCDPYNIRAVFSPRLVLTVSTYKSKKTTYKSTSPVNACNSSLSLCQTTP